MIHVYNTLTRKIEPFKPLNKNEVRMYVCGVTVYGPLHLGHARTYVAYDVIRRYLEEFKNLKVFFVQNITDVGHLTEVELGEDKILKQAKIEKAWHPMQVVDKYIQEMWNGLDALFIKRPTITPRATGHIPEIIDAVKALIEKGYAYHSNGTVYYDVAKFKDYGKLSGNTLEKLHAGARIEPEPGKKSPYDFALWKKADPQHILQWSSPWGKGFPGWHIECSVMSMKYLGETFDIHGGAVELAFPHHENEIAQSEALTGKKFVNYWIHTGVLSVGGQKMSKSLGNVILVSDLLKKYDPKLVRYFFASKHYRSPVDFQEANIAESKAALSRINEFVRKLRLYKSEKGYDEMVGKSLQEKIFAFERAMDDDFNTPVALAQLFELIRMANSYVDKNKLREGNAKELYDFIKKFDRVFNVLTFEEPEVSQLDAQILALIKEREQARSAKDWAKADQIRQKLLELGVEVSDTKEGPVWRKKN